MQSLPLRNDSDAPSSFNAQPTKPIKMPTPRNETPIDDSGVVRTPADSSTASYSPTVRPSPSPPRSQPHIRPHTTSSGADIEWFCCFCSTPNSIASFAAAISSSGTSPAALPNCIFCGITGCIDCDLCAATLSQRDVLTVPTPVAVRFPSAAPGSKGLWNLGVGGMDGMSGEEMEIARRREMAEKADEELRRQMERGVEEWERETRRRKERERAVNGERMRMERELDELERLRSRFKWEEGIRGRLVPQESWEDEEAAGEVYESYEEEARWVEAQRLQHRAQGENVGSGTGGGPVQKDEYEASGSRYSPRYQPRY